MKKDQDILPEYDFSKGQRGKYAKLFHEMKTAKAFEIASLPKFKGKQVKRIRKSVNLTQKTFAELFGVSYKTVEAWEDGTNLPSGPAQRILGALKKDTDNIRYFGLTIKNLNIK